MLLFFAVDEEFEAVATQVSMRTQSMVNKYRRLLMVEAEVGLAQSTLKKKNHWSCSRSVLFQGICISAYDFRSITHKHSSDLYFTLTAVQPFIRNSDD